MKKNILKNNRGISLITLIVTIIVLAILVSLSIRNMDTGTDIRNYNYMCADIELLETKVMTYYNEKGTLPVKGDPIADVKSTLGAQASSRDNDIYYQIDVSQLYNITLNYGGGNISNRNIYIINEQSHEIYYYKGTEYQGTTYYKHM